MLNNTDPYVALEEWYWFTVNWLINWQILKRNHYISEDFADTMIRQERYIIRSLEYIIWDTLPDIECQCGQKLDVTFYQGQTFVDQCPSCWEMAKEAGWDEGYCAGHRHGSMGIRRMI